jgi:hypothetical protein
MDQLCQHKLMNRRGEICGLPAKFLVSLRDGTKMLVCGRHANSLASRSNLPLVMVDLTLAGQVVR